MTLVFLKSEGSCTRRTTILRVIILTIRTMSWKHYFNIKITIELNNYIPNIIIGFLIFDLYDDLIQLQIIFTLVSTYRILKYKLASICFAKENLFE